MTNTWKPTVAGILSIVAGAVDILIGIWALARKFVRRVMFHWRAEALGALALVVGIVAIVGGIFAIRRQVWGMALAGAICALFPPHIAVLGILAIIFVSLSHDGFIKKSSGTPETKPPQTQS